MSSPTISCQEGESGRCVGEWGICATEKGGQILRLKFSHCQKVLILLIFLKED